MSLDRVPILSGPQQFLEGGYTISSGMKQNSLLRVPEVLRFNNYGLAIETDDYSPEASPPPPPPPLCIRVIRLCWSQNLGDLGGCHRYFSCWKHFDKADYPTIDPPCPPDGKLSYFPAPNPPGVSLSAATCYSHAGPNECHCLICCVGYPSTSCTGYPSHCTWETPCGVGKVELADCLADGTNC